MKPGQNPTQWTADSRGEAISPLKLSAIAALGIAAWLPILLLVRP